MLFFYFIVVATFTPLSFTKGTIVPSQIPLKVPSPNLQKYILQRRTTMLYPFPKKCLVGPYGLTKSKLLRFGWDFRGKLGNKIRLSDGGQVIFSGWIQGYGNSLLIRSDKNFIFFYAGNIDSSLKKTDIVTKGSFLGKLREDGIWFFAVFCQGWPINPEYLLHSGEWWKNLNSQ